MDVRNVTIRKFRTEDAAAVSRIIRDNLTQVNSKDYPESVIKHLYDMFSPKFILSLSNKRKIHVATDDNVVVGTACLDYDTIYTVFVDMKYHGKGVGKKLVALLEEIAENHGLRVVKLTANITSQRFYEKLGYTEVEEINSPEFGREIIMEKYLV